MSSITVTLEWWVWIPIALGVVCAFAWAVNILSEVTERRIAEHYHLDDDDFWDDVA